MKTIIFGALLLTAGCGAVNPAVMFSKSFKLTAPDGAIIEATVEGETTAADVKEYKTAIMLKTGAK